MIVRSRPARCLLLGACAAAALTSPAWAQADEGVEGIEVRAARLPPTIGDRALSTVTINAAALDAGDRLDQILTATPGVQLFRRVSSAGANPTTQGISVRGVAGSGAGRALVTLDGVPQNDPFGGWVIWSGLAPEAIEQATVIRGAGAGPYGAGALTGVIALDERAAANPFFRGEASVGEVGYGRLAGAGQIGEGGVRLFLSGAAENGSRWTPVRRGKGRADAPLTLESWNLAGRLSVDVGRATVAARFAGFDEARGSGLVGAASEASGVNASLTVAAPPVTDGALGWRVQGWWRRSNLENSSVAVGAGRATTTPANDQYATPADGYGLNAALRRVTENLTLETGVDARWTKGETQELFRYMGGDFTRTRVAGGQTLVTGLYAEASYTTGPWLVTGGLRVDRWRSWDAKRVETDRATGAVTLNAAQADADGTTPTGRFAVRRDLAGGLYVRAGAYAGFRPATLNELHRPFRVGNDVTEANPGLKPEKLYGAEAGLGGEAGFVSWSANVFVNRLHDAITNVTIGGPGTYPIAGLIPVGGVLRQRQNAGDIDAVGVEGDFSLPLGSTLSLRGAAGYTHAEVDGGTSAPQLTGLRPAQTPRFTGSLGLDWLVVDRLTTRFDLRYESARWDDDQNSRRLSPALTLDARADYALTSAFGVFVAVDNVTNKAVETGQTADGVESFTLPRRVRAGIVWKM